MKYIYINYNYKQKEDEDYVYGHLLVILKKKINLWLVSIESMAYLMGSTFSWRRAGPGLEQVEDTAHTINPERSMTSTSPGEALGQREFCPESTRFILKTDPQNHVPPHCYTQCAKSLQKQPLPQLGLGVWAGEWLFLLITDQQCDGDTNDLIAVVKRLIIAQPVPLKTEQLG